MRTSFLEQISALRRACGKSTAKDHLTVLDAVTSLATLYDVQQELHQEEPDHERVADLLVSLFVPVVKANGDRIDSTLSSG